MGMRAEAAFVVIPRFEVNLVNGLLIQSQSQFERTRKRSGSIYLDQGPNTSGHPWDERFRDVRLQTKLRFDAFDIPARGFP